MRNVDAAVYRDGTLWNLRWRIWGCVLHIYDKVPFLERGSLGFYYGSAKWMVKEKDESQEKHIYPEKSCVFLHNNRSKSV